MVVFVQQKQTEFVDFFGVFKGIRYKNNNFLESDDETENGYNF